MKKIAFILLCVSILLAAQPALANSAPIHYFSEGPHYTMGVLEDCDIGVEKEDLRFDIHFEAEDSSFMDVSASYQMRNHGAAQSITMAFPILFILDDIDALTNAEVHVDGQAIHAEPLFISSLRHLAEKKRWTRKSYDEIEEYAQSLEIESLLDYYNDPVPYHPETYDFDAVLNIYELQGQSGANYIKITRLREENLRIFSYTSDGATAYRSKSNNNDYVIEIHKRRSSGQVRLAVSAGFDMSQAQIEAYDMDGNYPNESSLTPISNAGLELVQVQSMTMEEFLGNVCMQEFREYYPEGVESFGERELLTLLGGGVDFYGCDSIRGILRSLFNEKMAGLLLYEIPFEAGQSREVSVTYKHMPDSFGNTGDMRADYSYITGPARHYRDFGTLNVWVWFVNRPENYETYVRSEAVEFEKLEEDLFFASMEGLPQDQLTFTVSCIEDQVPWGLYFLLALLTLLIVAMVSILIVYIVYRRNMKRMRAGQRGST